MDRSQQFFWLRDLCLNQPLPCALHMFNPIISLPFDRWPVPGELGRAADRTPCPQVTCNNCAYCVLVQSAQRPALKVTTDGQSGQWAAGRARCGLRMQWRRNWTFMCQFWISSL